MTHLVAPTVTADTSAMQSGYLTNQLLIAMPTLEDPNFGHTVTLICEHSDKGALGIILNRPLNMVLGDVFEQLSLETNNNGLKQQLVLRGGPVQQERGFVLHRPGGAQSPVWDSTMCISKTLHVTTSRDILTAMASGAGPSQAIVALGYAGWDAGQLDEEIRANTWLTVPVDDSILFDTPYEQRWQAAGRLLGVDFGRLAMQAGHA